MSVCGDFGGVTAKGEPCQHRTDGLCSAHRENAHHPGRPSAYSDEIAETICMRLISGDSLRTICGDDGMPAKSTVLHWVVENRQGFADQYARARAAQAYEMADDLLDIADDGRNDTYTDDEGQERVNYDHIQRSKLRVDTRKWVLSRMLPKLYGNKQEVKHSGQVNTGVLAVPAEADDWDAVAKRMQSAPAPNGKNGHGSNGNGRG